MIWRFVFGMAHVDNRHMTIPYVRFVVRDASGTIVELFEVTTEWLKERNAEDMATFAGLTRHGSIHVEASPNAWDTETQQTVTV